MKIENNYTPENIYNVYSNLFQQQQQHQQQMLQQQQQQLMQVPARTSSPSSKLWSAREERLEILKNEAQESLKLQDALRVKLLNLTKSADSEEKKNFIYLTQMQISEEFKKYGQILDEQKRIEKQLKRKRPNKKQNKKQQQQQQNDENNEDDYIDDDENSNCHQQENDTAVASLKHYTGDFTNNKSEQHHQSVNDNDDENINVDEYDDENNSTTNSQHIVNMNELASSTLKTDTNNNRSFV